MCFKIHFWLSLADTMYKSLFGGNDTLKFYNHIGIFVSFFSVKNMLGSKQ